MPLEPVTATCTWLYIYRYIELNRPRKPRLQCKTDKLISAKVLLFFFISQRCNNGPRSVSMVWFFAASPSGGGDCGVVLLFIPTHYGLLGDDESSGTNQKLGTARRWWCCSLRSRASVISRTDRSTSPRASLLAWKRYRNPRFLPEPPTQPLLPAPLNGHVTLVAPSAGLFLPFLCMYIHTYIHTVSICIRKYIRWCTWTFA